MRTEGRIDELDIDDVSEETGDEAEITGDSGDDNDRGDKKKKKKGKAPARRRVPKDSDKITPQDLEAQCDLNNPIYLCASVRSTHGFCA